MKNETICKRKSIRKYDPAPPDEATPAKVQEQIVQYLWFTRHYSAKQNRMFLAILRVLPAPKRAFSAFCVHRVTVRSVA
ncbi:MAG: hypothetical protein LBI54_09405, partial [Lachnospiraceae bacterium]|nr:hypothetical protein [Lachnospiraceae bacterium]